MAAELSLRERKKLKAMRHIQRVAVDLFDQHGYDAVSIERIAAEAEVSPSSIYRYFGTKEQLILHDEYDPVAVRALDNELAARDPITALRKVITEMVEVMMSNDDEDLVRRRMSYAVTVPAVRAGMYRQGDEVNADIRALLAKHTGRDPNELEIRVLVAALVAGFLASIEYCHAGGYRESLHEVLDRSLDVMTGLSLEWRRAKAPTG